MSGRAEADAELILFFSVRLVNQKLKLAEAPNARINPTADIITQRKSEHPMLMKGKLRRVGLNELLGAA